MSNFHSQTESHCHGLMLQWVVPTKSLMISYNTNRAVKTNLPKSYDVWSLKTISYLNYYMYSFRYFHYEVARKPYVVLNIVLLIIWIYVKSRMINVASYWNIYNKETYVVNRCRLPDTSSAQRYHILHLDCILYYNVSGPGNLMQFNRTRICT